MNKENCIKENLTYLRQLPKVGNEKYIILLKKARIENSNLQT